MRSRVPRGWSVSHSRIVHSRHLGFRELSLGLGFRHAAVSTDEHEGRQPRDNVWATNVFVQGSFPRQEHRSRLILSLHTWAPLLFKTLTEADVPNTREGPSQLLSNFCKNEEGMAPRSMWEGCPQWVKWCQLLFPMKATGGSKVWHKEDPPWVCLCVSSYSWGVKPLFATHVVMMSLEEEWEMCKTLATALESSPWEIRSSIFTRYKLWKSWLGSRDKKYTTHMQTLLYLVSMGDPMNWLQCI